MPFGLHLMVDGLTATPPTVDEVRRFIFEAVKKAGLHIISGPMFHSLESHEQAFAVIAESHVAVQWWPQGLVLVELFSCKPFDADSVVAFTVKTFQLEHWRHRMIERMGVGGL